MAEVNPPLAVEVGGEHAAQWRQSIGALAGDRLIGEYGGSGVCGPLIATGADGDLAVTAKGDATLTVVVAAGRAFVRGTENDQHGHYLIENDGNVELVLDPAGAADRIDLIVARVRDNSVDLSGVNAWALEIVKGVDLNYPALPSSSIPLAAVRVNTGTTQVTGPGTGAGQVENRRYHHLESTPSGLWTCSAFVIASNVPNGAPTRLQFDNAIWDPRGMFTAPTVTIPAPGIYLVTAAAKSNGNYDSGFAWGAMVVRMNATSVIEDGAAVGTGQFRASATRELQCDTGDEIDVRVEHTSGAAEAHQGRLTVSWQRPKPSGFVPV